MKANKVVEEALQDIRDIFEDITQLRETIDTEPSNEAWYEWSIDYLMDNLSIPRSKAEQYLEKLNVKKRRR